MLNELYQLACTLEKQGLLQGEENHRDVHKLGKCECLYIRLDSEGRPSSMRLLNKSDTAKLWVHSKGNHVRFPAIKVQLPLLPREVSKSFDEEQWSKGNLNEKCRLLAELDYSYGNEDSREIWVKPWTLEQMKTVMESDVVELEALRRLLIRFPREDNEGFYESLRKFIKSRMNEVNEEMTKFLKQLLIGTYDSKKGRYVSRCMCYFDIQELGQVENAVASEDTESALIHCLNMEQAEDASDVETAVSALSGEQATLLTDKYPNPKLPVIGPTYLFSNNTQAIPCLTRYGMERMEPFPVGTEQVHKICEALSFLTADERKDMTWRSFWGTSGAKPMLLLAWIEDDPQCNAKLAQAVGEDGATAVYEEKCRDVLETFKGKLAASPDTPVHLQLFEAVDTGRKQIYYSDTMNVRQLYYGMDNWLKAAENIPKVSFRVNFKNEKGEPVNRYRPYAPGPGAICKLLRTEYRTQNGMGAGRLQDSKAAGLTVPEIYHFYLPDLYSGIQNEKLVAKMQEEVLRVSADLLMDAGHFQTAALKGQPFSQECMQRICAAVSLLGIILYKKGIRKEQFMESKMFLVGRTLKLADQLHRNYCIIVRNNETIKTAVKPLPSQLMGSSVFQLALQNPTEALVRLGEKITVYTDWANTKPESHSKWILRLLGQTAAAIGSDGEALPRKLSSDEKAQLLLGYLAELPYDDPADSNKEKSQNKEDGINE